MSEPNLSDLASHIQSSLLGQFSVILDGGIDALRGPIQEISSRLALAATRGDQELMDACKDQIALVAKEQALNVRSGVPEGTLNFVITQGITMLTQGAAAGLNSVRPD